MIAFILVIIGGVNWGLFGLFTFDFVETVFGSWSPTLAEVIYTLIGIAAVYLAITHVTECRVCAKKQEAAK